MMGFVDQRAEKMRKEGKNAGLKHFPTFSVNIFKNVISQTYKNCRLYGKILNNTLPCNTIV